MPQVNVFDPDEAQEPTHDEIDLISKSLRCTGMSLVDPYSHKPVKAGEELPNTVDGRIYQQALLFSESHTGDIYNYVLPLYLGSVRGLFFSGTLSFVKEQLKQATADKDVVDVAAGTDTSAAAPIQLVDAVDVESTTAD